jgi:hypothetical protein
MTAVVSGDAMLSAEVSADFDCQSFSLNRFKGFLDFFPDIFEDD